MAVSNIRIRASKKIGADFVPVIQFIASSIGLDGTAVDGKTEEGRAALAAALNSGLSPEIAVLGSGRQLDHFGFLLASPADRDGEWQLEFSEGFTLTGAFGVVNFAEEGSVQGSKVGGISLKSTSAPVMT